jgi:hypothetical protein
MEVEAALPPPYIRLNNSLRRYAFRALKLAPNHPIPAEIEKSITTTPSFDIIDDIYDQNEEDELAIANYHQTTSLDASITPLVTTTTNPINQVFRSQGAEVNNSAPNSLIAQIAQLSISATVQENRTNQKEHISPATVSIATSPDASIVPFHYLYKGPTRDRARALIAEDIPTFRISTDVTYVPPLASQNNSISLQENIGESSFWASLAPLVTSSPDPANQIPQSQNAELNNSAPNSSIAQIAQLSISATVPDSLENQENSLASNKKLKYYQNDPNPRIEHNLARTAKLLRPIRVRPGNRPRKEPKLTQLERIYKSIYGLYLTSSLEVIKHHYFAPWNRTTPY